MLSLTVGVLVLGLLLLGRLRKASDDRRRGVAQIVFASISVCLSFIRLGLIILSIGDRMLHRTLGVLDTIFLGLAIALTLLHLLFDVIPGRFEKRVPPIIHELVAMVAFVVIVLGALGDTVAKNVSSLIATSAVLTAVLGLALQSTLSNLFAGLALQMDRAISAGDWISVGGRVGRIVEIRWRSTALRTLDGDMVLLPNSRMLSEEVHNYSRPSNNRRVSIKVAFHYRHPPNTVRAAVAECIRGVTGVLSDPAPDCFPVEFSESAVVYTVRFWVNEFARTAEIEGEALTRIWYAAQREGLEIPFPIRTLLMKTDESEKRDAEAKTERKRRIELLDGMDLFDALERSDKEILADGIRKVPFAAGQAIIEQGAAGTSMYIIIKGEVRVSLAHGNARRDLATLTAGQFFGEMSMLTGEVRAATCWAVGDVDCYVVDHEAMSRVLSASPNIAEELAQTLVDRQSAVSKEADDLKRTNPQETRMGLVTRIRFFFDIN
jgi:small-conductance mechanosensitive channel/CRP-like cAMP-binding protein